MTNLDDPTDILDEPTDTLETHSETTIDEGIVIPIDLAVPTPALYLALTASCNVFSDEQLKTFLQCHAKGEPDMAAWAELQAGISPYVTALELCEPHIVEAVKTPWWKLTADKVLGTT